MPRRAAAVAAVAAVAVPAALAAPGGHERAGSPAQHAQPGAPATGAASLSRERVRLGRSVRGRRIHAVRLGHAGARRTVLVVGAVHGDEPAGRAVARRLETGALPRRTDLWVVRDLNPDGHAAGTRVNARGVDLNRNFPERWRRLRRGRFFSGPRPASEPETRIAQRLIRRIRPDLTIWIHQPYGIVVDGQAADPAVERRVSRLLGLPLRRLPRYSGTAIAWQRSELPRSDALVVELGDDVPAPSRVARALRRLAP
jgi:protein MpaA